MKYNHSGYYRWAYLATVLISVGSRGYAASSAISFDRVYKSEEDLALDQNPRRATKNSGRVQFRDATKRVIKELTLRHEAPDQTTEYKEDAIVLNERVLIRKTTTQAESPIQSLDLYDLAGNQVSQIRGAEKFWASPSGRIIVVADTTETVPLFAKGAIHVYDRNGKLVAEPKLFDFWGDARVIFSGTEGTFLYILTGMRSSPDGPFKSGVAILTADGEVLGTYAEENWRPLEGVAHPGHATVSPIAILMEKAKHLLIQANMPGIANPFLYCINFDGRLLWKKELPLNSAITTVQADPTATDFSIVELGEKALISSYDLESGSRIKAKESALVLPSGVWPKVSRSGKMFAISAHGLKRAGSTRNAVVIDDDANLQWEDAGDDPDAQVNFSSDGKLILRKNHEIRVAIPH